MADDRTYSRSDVVTMLRGVQRAVDEAWNSPSVQQALAKAHATLDKVAMLPADEQKAYWDRVSTKIKAKTEEMKRAAEAKK